MELELPGIFAQYGYKYIPFKDAPYAAIINMYDNPAMISNWPRAPFFKLPPSDVALLESDPELRQRWIDFVMYSLLPPARKMVDVYSTQVRLCPCNFTLVPTKRILLSLACHAALT